MAVFKCKMCGGDLQAEQGSEIGTCASCGTTSRLPAAGEDRLPGLFSEEQTQDLIRGIKKALVADTNSGFEEKQRAEDFVPQAFVSQKQIKRLEMLLERKRNASSEKEFRVLAKAFEALQGFEGTSALADECMRKADEIASK